MGSQYFVMQTTKTGRIPKLQAYLCLRRAHVILLCPQLWRSCGSILVSGCPCMHPPMCLFVKNSACYFFWNFIWKSSKHFFFLTELSPFLELCPFEKISMKSDACHILWTVQSRVLKFHIWIPRGKIADPYFFSCPNYLPFWSYAPLKKSEWNLASKIPRKVFELGAWNLVSW